MPDYDAAGSRLRPPRYGVYTPLEDEADRLIYDSIKHITSHEAKKDILTRWKQADRWSKEVYSAEGVVDPATRRGMYHRALNRVQTELNSRDGVARPRKGQVSGTGWDGGDDDD